MPQSFHVLKCYKCYVFQVHQTKKSNKWECKLCGEKQSMKRHYGFGTGKECRLHVQKLNSIRAEIDENNDIGKLNESSDKEIKVKHDTKVPNVKPANLESKWSEFVEKTEDLKEPELSKSMYLGNDEVVLEVPPKRRMFNKPKFTKNAPTLNTYSNKPDNKFRNLRESPSPPPIKFYETQMSNIQNTLKEVANGDQFIMADSITPTDPKKQQTNTFVPHKLDKNSKWAQFADEFNEEKSADYFDCAKCNLENDTVIVDKPNNDVIKRKGENICNVTLNNIFSLCDENDLDDVLKL